MEVFNKYILPLLFFVCAYRYGYSHGNGQFNEYSEKWHKQVIVRTYYFFIDPLFWLVDSILDVAKIPFLWAYSYFQVSFYFEWVFSRDKWILEPYQLKRMNGLAKNVRNKKTIKDRIFRNCVRLVNELNNYDPSQYKEEEF